MPLTTPLTGSPLDPALEAGVPPFSWMPPEWPAAGSKPTLGNDCYEVDEPPTFESPTPLNCIVSLNAPLNKLRDIGGTYGLNLQHVKAQRELELSVDEEPGTELKKLPHPGSDFSHEDIDGDDHDHEEAPAGPTGRGLTPATEEAAASANPQGMPRLKLVFEHTLCSVTTLLGQLNAALDADSQVEYETARKAYIALLHDLDDHAPKEDKRIPGKSGYGRSLKWFFVQPVIHGGRIHGANVVGKWNPHFSSSGVPVPHP